MNKKGQKGKDTKR